MPYKIPLFKLNYTEEESLAVLETLESKWISTGPKCQEFEEKFSKMCGTKYSISLANCTAALHLALKAMDIKPGDEVIVPSLTFVATVNSVRYVGAVPIFADITSVDDFSISISDIKRKITKRTKAIIPMHFAGYSVDMESLMEIAKENGLKVIEDACHGPFSEYNGQKLGSIGDVGCFSFFSNKNISTGEGGMLVTNNDTIAENIKLLRSHGMTTMSFQRAKGHATTYDVISNGYNYRMDDLRASLGIVQLDKIKKDYSKRADVRKYYVNELEDIEEITIPYLSRSEYSSNYIMPIVLNKSSAERRNNFREYLHEHGIQTSIHYPAVHRFSVFKKYATSELPLTEYVCDNEVTLPIFADLKKEEVSFICNTIKHALINI